MDPLSRREFLAKKTAALAAAPVALSASSPLSGGRKLKVVVTGGHPGDPEYGCGGTVARYTDLGHEVTLLYLNRGEKTCPDTDPAKGSAIRVPEAQKASAILKARAAFADQCDGQAIVDAAHYDEFRKLIESENPDVLFTQWPVDAHRDHRATSMLSYDAWLRLGKKFALYYYEVSDGEDTFMFSPTEYVDITATEPRKRSACYAHASQTPERYYELQSQVARFRGIESGYRYAEAFVRHVQSPAGLLP